MKLLKPGDYKSILFVRSMAGLFFWMACFSLAVSAYLVWGSPEVMRGVDYGLVHHAYRGFFRQAILDGEFPLWNPYALLGRPFMADPETAVWYPATWLYLFFSDSVAYWLGLSAHVYLAMCGMFRLARSWNCGVVLSVFAGLAFVVSPPYAGHLQGGLIGFVHTLSWWPLGLLFVDRLCIRPSLRDWLILSMVFALAFLAGHSHAFWLIGCSLGFYAFGRSLNLNPVISIKKVFRVGVLILGALVFGLCMCAMQLIPMLELVEQGNRASSKAFAAFGSQTWEGLSSIVSIVKGEDALWWDGNLYVGLPVVLFGLLTVFTRCEPRIRGLMMMGGVSLLLSLGPLTPIFDWLFPLIPGFGGFRHNVRFGMFGVFALILLCVGYWRISESDGSPTGLRHIIISVLVAFVWLPLHLHMRYTLNLLLFVIYPIVVLFLYLLLRRNPAVMAWVRGYAHQFSMVVFITIWIVDFVPAAIELDRSFQSYGGRAAREYERYYRIPEAVINALDQEDTVEPPRFFIPIEVMHSNSGMINGVSMVTGNNALAQVRVWEYLHRAAGVIPNPFVNNYLPYEVYESGPFPYKGSGVSLGFSVKQRVMVYLQPEDRGPRAWVSGCVFPLENWLVAIRDHLPDYDPFRITMVESPYMGLLKHVSGQASGEARFLRYSRNQIDIEVESSGNAILVLSEAWFPGWKCEIDGVDSPVFPVNIWMRGVVVPDGSHQVRFFYQSTYLPMAFFITFVCIVLWLMLYVRSLRSAHSPD